MFGLFGAGNVELLSDGAIFARLRELVVNASEEVLLIAPYVEPNDDFVRTLKEAARKIDRVEIWFRDDKVDEYRGAPWFGELSDAGVSFSSVKRLHAKLYLADDKCLATSMNLTKASWNDSREFGCAFPATGKNAETLNAFIESLEGERREVGPPQRKRKERRWGRAQAKSEPRSGFCIRCASAIPFEPGRPYCKADYDKWAQYKNPDFKDEYCHECGKAFGATMAKPFCSACWKS